MKLETSKKYSNSDQILTMQNSGEVTMQSQGPYPQIQYMAVSLWKFNRSFFVKSIETLGDFTFIVNSLCKTNKSQGIGGLHMGWGDQHGPRANFCR